MNKIMSMLTAAVILAGTAVALAGDCCNSCNSGCREGRCPQSCKSCTAHLVPGKEKKTCFLTECQEICIPKFRWPWQCGCKPECGRVKTVRVLKVKEYECNKCKWEWKINGCAACEAGCCFEHHGMDKQAEPPIPPAPSATSLPYRSTSHVPTP